MKREVLVLGAGKIGGAIVDLLHAAGDYRITLADSDAAFLAQAAQQGAAQQGAAGQKAVAKVEDFTDLAGADFFDAGEVEFQKWLVHDGRKIMARRESSKSKVACKSTKLQVPRSRLDTSARIWHS